MPNPKKKIDCTVLYDTYTLLLSCPPAEFAEKIAGGKFTSPEYMTTTTKGLIETGKENFDSYGKYGEYITYPGFTSVQWTSKCLANTERQQKTFENHSKYLMGELDDLTGNEKLNKYPATKGYLEYRKKFLKSAMDGIDRAAVLAETPGGYALRSFPDWTESKKGHEKNADQFEDMLTGMKYDKLFAVTDEYIDLELEMRNKVLTPEKLKECKDKRIDQNNRMVEIYEHQKSPKSKEKYWDFFNNYDDTIASSRGVQRDINALKEQNKALENGWDVSRLYLFLKMKNIATECKKAQETFDYFNEPFLKETKGYAKKVADLDPTDRKFESMEDFDKYMTKFHLAYTDLINKVSKPEVHDALVNVKGSIDLEKNIYMKKQDERRAYIEQHKGEPDYQEPPEPKRPKELDLETDLFTDLSQGVNSKEFRELREFGKCVDPAYYDLEGDKQAVEKRKAEIAAVKDPLLAEKANELLEGWVGAMSLVFKSNEKAEEIAKAQEYIDSTSKISVLASEKLQNLPSFDTFPKKVQNEKFKNIYDDYYLNLETVASIRNRSMNIIEDTNKDIENLVKASQKLSAELNKNKKKFPEEFRQSVADSVEKFTGHYLETQKKAEGFTASQDMIAYIDVRKHDISCFEASMNVDCTKEQIFDAKESLRIEKAFDALGADIQRSNDANNVFRRHNDYDDAVNAMETLMKDLIQYKNFSGSKISNDNPDKKFLEESEKKAKTLLESADETSRKLETYLERKANEGSLNEKGRKRVEAFKKALETTKSISNICKDALLENDTRLVAMGTAEMLEKDIKIADYNIAAYQAAANDENLSDVERTAAKFAAAGAERLKEFISGNHELDEKEKQEAKEAIASINLFKKKMFDPKGSSDIDEYDKQVVKLAGDPDFSRSINLSLAGIRDFVAKDVNRDLFDAMDKLEELSSEKKGVLLSSEGLKEAKPALAALTVYTTLQHGRKKDNGPEIPLSADQMASAVEQMMEQSAFRKVTDGIKTTAQLRNILDNPDELRKKYTLEVLAEKQAKKENVNRLKELKEQPVQKMNYQNQKDQPVNNNDQHNRNKGVLKGPNN